MLVNCWETEGYLFVQIDFVTPLNLPYLKRFIFECKQLRQTYLIERSFPPRTADLTIMTWQTLLFTALIYKQDNCGAGMK